MEILNIFLGFLMALLGFPVGLILAKIAKEEIKQGKKYFKYMIYILGFAIISIFFYFDGGVFRRPDLLALVYSLLFMLLLPAAALFMSRKK